MKIIQIIRISLFNLLSKKSRTFFTIVAIAVSFAAVMILLSLGYGLQRLVEQQTVGLDALRIIDVDAENSNIVRLDADALSRIKAIAGVEKVVPQISAAGKVHIEGSTIDATVFLTDADYLDLSYNNTLWGDTSVALGETEMIINDVIPGLLDIEREEQIINKEVLVDVIFSPSAFETDEELQKSYTGLTRKIQSVVIDRKVENIVPIIYLPINQFPDLYSEAAFSKAKILISNGDELEDIRSKIEVLGFRTSSAADTVAQISSVFDTIRIVLSVIGFVGVTIAILGMFNTLTVSLMDRMREIGIMKALGMKGRYVLHLFLIESILMSLVGGILGLILSVLGGNILERFFQAISKAQNRPVVDFYYTPIDVVLLLLLFSVVAGFLTGIYPALRAKKMKPLDALRYE